MTTAGSARAHNKKVGIKVNQPGYLTDWTGSGKERPTNQSLQERVVDKIINGQVKKTSSRILKLTKYQQEHKKFMAECKARYPQGEAMRILKGLYKYSVYQKRNEDKFYPGKSTRRNRVYVWSQQWLADRLGISRWTVQRWLKRFEVAGIVYVCYRGYKDRGASIYELALNDAHRHVNRERTRARKRNALLLGVTPNRCSSIRCDT